MAKTLASWALTLVAANVFAGGVAILAGAAVTFVGFSEPSVVAVLAITFTGTFVTVLRAKD